jgi:MOSC domain-containing protein YiiM
MKRVLEAICTGTARPFNGAETSAIAKYPREGPVQVLPGGLAPDEQADRKNHGGPEMAVHLYPLDHHSFWREHLGAIDLLEQPGAFGSNLAVRELDESDVYIGDRFRAGTALLEISQPRKPCWKIEHRFGNACANARNAKGMVATIVQTGRAGWYFRVIETGEVEAGDAFERVETGHVDWSVARTFAALIAGQGTASDFAELSALERLTPTLRAKAAKRV